ncbi:ECF-type sigma factor [Marinoscillum sp.]|uniref:ECF-type sigma factor n=1 Tax=Marinoscillum sp. TaxID=2024838 RepID=UPI003BAB5B52
MISEAELQKTIERINQGDQKALDHLFPIVYQELRKSAHLIRLRFNQQDTLNTTALVHEAYLKLSQANLSTLENKNHFLNLAAKAIRQILVNACQKRSAQKRPQGSRYQIEDLEEQLMLSEESKSAILSIQEALSRLEIKQPTYTKIVECRFFAGLSIEETASIIGSSPSTVKRQWNIAKTWLHQQLVSVPA